MLVLGVASWLALTSPAELRWSGACDAQEAVERAVETELAGTQDEARWVEVDVEVVARESEGGVTAEILLTTESGETTRALQAATCEELEQAVGLLIAIHVDPYGGDLGAEPEPEPEPEPERRVVPEPTEAPEAPEAPEATESSAPSPPRAAPPSVASERGAALLHAGVGLTMGLLPQAAPTFQIAAGWSRGHLRLLGHVDYLPPQREQLLGGDITVQAWAVGGRGCGLVFVRGVTVPLCGGIGAGAVHGSAAGFAESGTDRRVQASATASTGVDWGIAPGVSFWCRVEGGATLARPRFQIRGLGTVFAARAWRAAATIGVRYDFL